jgi:hypothetical protein
VCVGWERACLGYGVSMCVGVLLPACRTQRAKEAAGGGLYAPCCCCVYGIRCMQPHLCVLGGGEGGGGAAYTFELWCVYVSCAHQGRAQRAKEAAAAGL